MQKFRETNAVENAKLEFTKMTSNIMNISKNDEKTDIFKPNNIRLLIKIAIAVNFQLAAVNRPPSIGR